MRGTFLPGRCAGAGAAATQGGGNAPAAGGRGAAERIFCRGAPEFDLPLAAKGTPFQQAGWAQLHKIPYGEVRTYGQLAAALGKPKASRAVGSACHRNPLCIVVPCHRVIGADGSLTGYAEGLEIKEYLLELERF